MEKAVIAADFNKLDDDEDANIDVENIDGDFLIMQNQQKQVQKDDVIFSSLEDNMLAVDHIIICGMVQNIKHFIEPLRSDSCDELTPIVILHEDLPSSRQWQQLQFYQ